MINVKNIVKALAAKKANAKGMTSREIAKELNVGLAAARVIIHGAHDAGMLEYAGRRPVASLDGRLNNSPCYRFISKKGK